MKIDLDNNSISPVGWYIASVVERFVPVNGDNQTFFHTWENLILVKATSLLEAYAKIIKDSKKADTKDVSEYHGKKGRWAFEGVSDLVPIYEELEDLAELLWTDHGKKSRSSIKKMILTKQDLLRNYQKKEQA